MGQNWLPQVTSGNACSFLPLFLGRMASPFFLQGDAACPLGFWCVTVQRKREIVSVQRMKSLFCDGPLSFFTENCKILAISTLAY